MRSQHVRDVGPLGSEGKAKGSLALAVDWTDLSTSTKEESDKFHVALFGRPVEGPVAVLVRGVYVSACCDDQSGDPRVPIPRCHVKWSHANGVAVADVATADNEALQHTRIILLGSKVHRGATIGGRCLWVRATV